MTFVGGGFFLDYQDIDQCGTSEYVGSSKSSDYVSGSRASADCLWNIQSLTNRTTTVASRSLQNSYQTERPTWEVEVRRHLLRDATSLEATTASSSAWAGARLRS